MALKDEMLSLMSVDLDRREGVIRRAVYDHLPEFPAPDTAEHIVATYFIMTRSRTIAEAAEETASHQTSAIRNPPPGSLLAACTGRFVDRIAFDAAERAGLVRIAFPTRNILNVDPDGSEAVYSTDIMHIIGGAVQFAFRENMDIKLVHAALDPELRAMFPGPAFGPAGLREYSGFDREAAFGAIVKPCTGITPEEDAEVIAQAAANPMFLFVKEDENLHPNAGFCPVAERVRLARRKIDAVQAERGSSRIVFCPHITSPPGVFESNLEAAVENGADGVMFSETYIGGHTRRARDLMAGWGTPRVIYGHNGGITHRTRHIYREVLDYFARLDGIDLRQTGPMGELAYLRPYGLEWEKSEEVLSMELPGIRPVMIARAGGLDQGNIIINLADIKARGRDPRDYLMLAGSAINGWKNRSGEYDPAGGARAMAQALEAFADPGFDNSESDHAPRLLRWAREKDKPELAAALEQRYGIA